MKVYRIDKSTYKDEFPPKGSLYGVGRWNTKDMWVVYTSDSIALAKLETFANSIIFPKNKILRVIEIRDDAPVIEITRDDLPDHWNTIPYPPILASMIKALLATKAYVAAIVPSVQSPKEKNILLFPDYPDFPKYVKEIEQLEESFDPRFNM